jgi:hypothetical protein
VGPAKLIGRNHSSQVGARLLQDRRDTVRDQVRRLEIDFVYFFICKLAFACVDVLKRHQEDRRCRLRVLPGWTSQP